MVAERPDCTGQKFGALTVLRKGEIVADGAGRPRRLWELQCDCGEIIKRPRYDFEHGRMVSCGCLKKQRFREMRLRDRIDYTGRRYGSLVGIGILPGVKHFGVQAWSFRCDCGAIVVSSSKRLYSECVKNCGNRHKHPENWQHYPATPNPYPPEAGAIVTKYLHLAVAKKHWPTVDQAKEDYRMERLLRAAWILTYKRSQGEEISELKEQCYIAKSLRFAGLTVDRRRRKGNLSYNRTNQFIGSVMTDLTSQNEAVAQAETQPESSLSSRKTRRVKFKRC